MEQEWDLLGGCNEMTAEAVRLMEDQREHCEKSLWFLTIQSVVVVGSQLCVVQSVKLGNIT